MNNNNLFEDSEDGEHYIPKPKWFDGDWSDLRGPHWWRHENNSFHGFMMGNDWVIKSNKKRYHYWDERNAIRVMNRWQVEWSDEVCGDITRDRWGNAWKYQHKSLKMKKRGN